MTQLTIKGFKSCPNINIEDIFDYIEEHTIIEEPSTKEIRLAIDLANQAAPMKFDRNDMVRSLLSYNVSDERINKVRPFKRIVKKKLITNKNGKVTTISVIRKRSK